MGLLGEHQLAAVPVWPPRIPWMAVEHGGLGGDLDSGTLGSEVSGWRG